MPAAQAAAQAPVVVNVMPTGAAHVLAAARQADERAVPRLILPDSGADSHDPWVLLGAAASFTSRVRLGMITNPFTRRPEVTAGALRTLDEVSSGRGFAIMSVGGAFQLQSMGASRDRPLQAITEAVRMIRARHPAGELWIATKGPRTLRLATEEADGVLLSGVPFALLPQVVQGLRPAGRPFTVALTLHHRFDDESTHASRERLVYELLNLRPEYADAAGITPALLEAVAGAVREQGPQKAAALVPDDVLRQFYLEGSRDDVVGRARALAAECGLDEIVLPERSLL